MALSLGLNVASATLIIGVSGLATQGYTDKAPLFGTVQAVGVNANSVLWANGALVTGIRDLSLRAVGESQSALVGQQVTANGTSFFGTCIASFLLEIGTYNNTGPLTAVVLIRNNNGQYLIWPTASTELA